MSDYLKLAREARERAPDWTRPRCECRNDINALCDAIEAQALKLAETRRMCDDALITVGEQAAEIETLRNQLSYAKCVALGRVAGDLRSE